MDIFFMLSQIDKLCRKHHMTKAEFYEKVGVTASAVSQWRNGKTEPAETTIHRIADLFNQCYAKKVRHCCSFFKRWA